MLFLTIKIKLNNITFNSFKTFLIKAVSAVTALNITYFAFNVFFITTFYNFKAYDIKRFIIKKTYLIINLKGDKLLIKLKFTVLYNPKLLY